MVRRRLERFGLLVIIALLGAACGQGDAHFADGGAPDSGVPDTCGNGTIDGIDECDGSNLDGATCVSIKGPGYFESPGKALACNPDCTLDTSACTNACMLDVPGSQLDSCVLQ